MLLVCLLVCRCSVRLSLIHRSSACLSLLCSSVAGPLLVYHWSVTGLSVRVMAVALFVCHWSIVGLSLVYHWSVTGLLESWLLSCHWSVTGLSLSCHWSVC